MNCICAQGSMLNAPDTFFCLHKGLQWVMLNARVGITYSGHDMFD